MGRWFIYTGAVLIIIGLLLHFVPTLFNWFGRLPGDIHSESENGKLFIPITSMIIVSIVLTILINIFKR